MSARRTFVAIVVAAMLFFAGHAHAQRSGRGGNSAKISRQGNAGSTQQDRRPIFVSGRVAVDDGTSPPEHVAIDRVCSGKTRRETYANSTGAFSFQMGTEAAEVQDASVGTSDADSSRPQGTLGNSGMAVAPSQAPGIDPRDLVGCELRAAAPGFISEPVSLSGRQAFDNPDIGTIVLHPMGKVEGTKVSVTTLQAPGEAKKCFDRAHKALERNHRAEAEAELQKAVTLYPKFAEALSDLGKLYVEQGRLEEAAHRLQQATEADPRFVPPYFNLAFLAGRQQDWPHMAELSERALALNSYEYPTAYFYNAIANYNLQKLDAAEKSARAARRLDSQYHQPRIDFLLGKILLQRDDYAGAAEQFRSFLKYQPTGSEADSARELLKDKESKRATAAVPKE